MRFRPIWGKTPVIVRGQPSGDPLRWTPQGFVSTALDLPNEPLRTYSWYGVRGSQKYPFGKAFPDYLELDSWDLGQDVSALTSVQIIVGVGILLLLLAKCQPKNRRKKK